MKYVVTIRLDETSDGSDGSNEPDGPMVECMSYEMTADQYGLVLRVAKLDAETVEIITDMLNDHGE